MMLRLPKVFPARHEYGSADPKNRRICYDGRMHKWTLRALVPCKVSQSDAVIYDRNLSGVTVHGFD